MNLQTPDLNTGSSFASLRSFGIEIILSNIITFGKHTACQWPNNWETMFNNQTWLDQLFSLSYWCWMMLLSFDHLLFFCCCFLSILDWLYSKPHLHITYPRTHTHTDIGCRSLALLPVILQKKGKKRISLSHFAPTPKDIHCDKFIIQSPFNDVIKKPFWASSPTLMHTHTHIIFFLLLSFLTL